MDVKHHDRDRILAHQRDRRGVHYPQIAREDIEIIELIIAFSVGVGLGVSAVDAIDLGALEQGVTAHFSRAQGGGGIGRKIGIAGAGGENHHPALLHMPHGAAADIGLAYSRHRNRGLNPGLHTDALE